MGHPGDNAEEQRQRAAGLPGGVDIHRGCAADLPPRIKPKAAGSDS
jgi:hypothetical protein